MIIRSQLKSYYMGTLNQIDAFIMYNFIDSDTYVPDESKLITFDIWLEHVYSIMSAYIIIIDIERIKIISLEIRHFSFGHYSLYAGLTPIYYYYSIIFIYSHYI